jgi:hypothetical protein
MLGFANDCCRPDESARLAAARRLGCTNSAGGREVFDLQLDCIWAAEVFSPLGARTRSLLLRPADCSVSWWVRVAVDLLSGCEEQERGSRKAGVPRVCPEPFALPGGLGCGVSHRRRALGALATGAQARG